jgi:uncharacterized protein (TIGR02118 family)
MKLVALYRPPPDPQAFEDAYFNTYQPLIAKAPGLQRTVITRFGPALTGEPFYLMAEMYFTDASALRAALKSPELTAASELLTTFAAGLVTIMFADEQKDVQTGG